MRFELESREKFLSWFTGYRSDSNLTSVSITTNINNPDFNPTSTTITNKGKLLELKLFQLLDFWANKRF